MFPYPYARGGLFSKGLGLTKAINWGGLLEGTQKTLGVINQAIPIVYQVKPIIQNAKTMFRIADEIRTPSNSDTLQPSENTTSTMIHSENRPIFYM